MKYCIHCGKQISDESRFCTFCGNPQGMMQTSRPTDTKEDFRRAGRALACILSLGMLLITIFVLFILYLGIPNIIEVWNYPVTIFVILNGVTPLFSVNAMLILYLFFIVMIAASLILLIKRSGAFAQEISTKPIKEHSLLYTVCTLIMASMAISFLFQIIIASALGNTIIAPDYSEYPIWTILYVIARAPVYEELISRVLLIGLPLLVVDFILNRIKGIEMNGLSKYVLGGGFRFGNKELLFLIISSIFFGYAHLGEWDVFKIIPSTVSGLCMGYLYLKYGLYASISFHAINNLLGFSTMFVPMSLSVAVIFSLMIYTLYIVGAIYFANYTVKTVKWLRNRYGKHNEEVTG